MLTYATDLKFINKSKYERLCEFQSTKYLMKITFIRDGNKFCENFGESSIFLFGLI